MVNVVQLWDRIGRYALIINHNKRLSCQLSQSLPLAILITGPPASRQLSCCCCQRFLGRLTDEKRLASCHEVVRAGRREWHAVSERPGDESIWARVFIHVSHDVIRSGGAFFCNFQISSSCLRNCPMLSAWWFYKRLPLVVCRRVHLHHLWYFSPVHILLLMLSVLRSKQFELVEGVTGCSTKPSGSARAKCHCQTTTCLPGEETAVQATKSAFKDRCYV